MLTLPARSAENSEIIERGLDHAVYQTVSADVASGGQTVQITNRFTLLENCLHYFEENQWKVSEDLIEVAPGGAVARRGPTKAIFSADLNDETVFDLLAHDGLRLRGGVRAIQLTDASTGQSIAVGVVKETVPGVLLPPNQILYADAFDGVRADVLLVWKHNLFSHEIIFRERPVLPVNWDPAAVRLEVVTEFLGEEQPELRSQTLQLSPEIEVQDDAVIYFGTLAIVTGRAFQVDPQSAMVLGDLSPDLPGIPVQKLWQRATDGRSYLIESVGWQAAWPMLENLDPSDQARVTPKTKRSTAATSFNTPSQASKPPMKLASASYKPTGCVIDFVTLPNNPLTTNFASGTYYFTNNYYSGSPLTFQSGAVLKFTTNAYFLTYGTLTFPNSTPEVVFTSRNDNNFGERIMSVSGETDSDGNPLLHKPSKALWIYYVTFSTTVKNARFRWATEAIHYDMGQGYPQYIQTTLLEFCDVGLYLNNAVLTLSSVGSCLTTTPIYYGGGSPSVQGSVTPDCGVVSEVRVNDPGMDDDDGDTNKNTQSECTFVLAGGSNIVAAFWDTHYSSFNLGYTNDNFPLSMRVARSTGWAVSSNGGATNFTDKGALLPAPTNTWQGDVGDPVMARDSNSGNIYLLVNPSREPETHKGFRLWKSTDTGQTFSLVSMNIFSNTNYTKADKPMMAVNNYPNMPNSGYIYVAGRGLEGGSAGGIVLSHSSDGGQTWQSLTNLLASSGADGADIAIRPDGTVYVFYIVSTNIQYRWLRTNETSWRGPTTVCSVIDRDAEMKRSNDATNAQDFFRIPRFPRVAVDSVSDRIYLVYANASTNAQGEVIDRGDIVVQKAGPIADDELQWTSAVRISDGGTDSDQWSPAPVINPAGTELFIGYYSRQRDTNNALIEAYGARVNLANGITAATFDVFPISSEAFPPWVPWNSTDSCATNQYDHVWAKNDVCLDENALLTDCTADENCKRKTDTRYEHFMADEYTWAAADESYFYYAWCDRSDLFPGGGGSRPDANVRFAKIKP